jgi:hypothetical protein
MPDCVTIEYYKDDTDNCKTLCRYFVCLYRYVGQGTFLDTIGKHFWITTVLLCLSAGSPIYMKHLSSDGRVSRSHILHSQFCEQLLKLRLVVAACGTKTRLPKWTAQLRKKLAFTGMKKYISFWNNRFWEFIYIYIHICVWFRTNCCYITNGTFGFPWSAKLGMPGTCCSLLMFYGILFCLYIPIFSYRWC